MTLRLIVRLSGGEEIGAGEEIPCKTDHRITVILYSDNSDSTVFLHYYVRFGYLSSTRYSVAGNAMRCGIFNLGKPLGLNENWTISSQARLSSYSIVYA
jgi:hypothetical protein